MRLNQGLRLCLSIQAIHINCSRLDLKALVDYTIEAEAEAQAIFVSEPGPSDISYVSPPYLQYIAYLPRSFDPYSRAFVLQTFDQMTHKQIDKSSDEINPSEAGFHQGEDENQAVSQTDDSIASGSEESGSKVAGIDLGPGLMACWLQAYEAVKAEMTA